MPHVTDPFHTYTDSNDLAILLKKDTFEPGAVSFTVTKSSTSKDTWRLAALAVRMQRRPPVATTKVPRNAVLLQPFCVVSTPTRHDTTYVDFIGGDFNMSAFSTVGDVAAGSP